MKLLTTQLLEPQEVADNTTSFAPAARWKRWLTTGRAVSGGYLILAFLLMLPLWIDPAGRHHSDNPGDDQVLFEWMLGHTPHAIMNLENPLFSDLLNAPLGANLMANTSVIAIGLVLAPVTWLFGAPVSYVLAMTLGLFGTAAGWYYLLRRHLRLSWLPAAVGGALAGFGPSTMAHSNGHINFTALMLVPFIVIAILRLREPGRAVPGGIILGSLLVAQMFIGEEVVFLIAIFMAVFVAVYACVEWQVVKPLLGRYLTGLTVAGVLSLGLLAYPLWFQFFGPQAYADIPWRPGLFPTDLASFMAYPTDSLGGRLQMPNSRLRHNVSEENTFFGIGAVVLVVTLAVLFVKHHKVLRSLIITSVVFALLSLGMEIEINGRATGVPGPYALVSDLPLFSHTIPTRFSLLLLPVVAILVAYGLQRAQRMRTETRRMWYFAFVLALLPLVPLPPKASERYAVPEFITAGSWTEYVEPGGTLVPVPIPEKVHYDGQRWQESADYGFAVPLGAFIGPDANGNGKWSGERLSTVNLMLLTMNDGTVPDVGADEQEKAAADLRTWEAEAVVLGPHEHRAELYDLMTQLLGPADKVDDVHVWRIDPATGEVRS